MPGIVVVTQIAAPREVVFDLARDVAVHLAGAAATGERVVGGPDRGLLGAGDVVTWSARHFGVRWTMTVRISGFEAPRWFRDELVSGPFTSFRHDHHFEENRSGTRMHEELVFRVPGGPLGRAAESFFVGPHLRRFLEVRNAHLRAVAEARVAAAARARAPAPLGGG